MRPRRNRTQRAFTLVEMMMVVLIISVLAMLAVPAIRRIQRKAKTTAIINDFRVFAAAFEAYAHENGGWPPETAAGVMPPAMVGRLQGTAWGRTTPMGGKYNWDNNQMQLTSRCVAAISIAAAAGAPLTLDVQQLTDLEEALDTNLDWLNGNFRLGTGLIPVFVIQQ